jgi:hypothetical protein
LLHWPNVCAAVAPSTAGLVFFVAAADHNDGVVAIAAAASALAAAAAAAAAYDATTPLRRPRAQSADWRKRKAVRRSQQ